MECLLQHGGISADWLSDFNPPPPLPLKKKRKKEKSLLMTVDTDR